LERARNHFAELVSEQLARVERMKQAEDWIDYSKLNPIIIGVCWGDGIGPIISQETQRILTYLLEDEIKNNKVEFRTIDGLTIENRAKHKKAIPDDVLAELKACHVILKAPTTTPEKGSPWPNIESANVAMRRYLDLFANVRPVKVPKEGIDWIFFRENTEGAYILGSKRRIQFRVVVLPNLYGDIITDEAAEFQGGVGTAGSANIGKRYAMFEAIHGSAPRMINKGRGKYAVPCSLIRASAMMLRHIGFSDKAEKLEMALDIRGNYEKKYVITGRETGCTSEEFGNYLMDTMRDPKLKTRWHAYTK